MYLTKFKLDLNHPQIRQALVNAHDMHRNIQMLFGDQRKDNNVLFAIQHTDCSCNLYLQSSTQPELGKELLSRYGFNMVYSSLQDDKMMAMKEGSTYSFILDAMPCKAVIQNDIVQRGKRQCLKDMDSRLKWLERKGEQGGFKVLYATECPGDRIHVLRQGKPYFLTRFRYIGQLIITDEKLFRDTIQKGIGPGKSYGLGLMLVS